MIVRGVVFVHFPWASNISIMRCVRVLFYKLINLPSSFFQVDTFNCVILITSFVSESDESIAYRTGVCDFHIIFQVIFEDGGNILVHCSLIFCYHLQHAWCSFVGMIWDDHIRLDFGKKSTKLLSVVYCIGSLILRFLWNSFAWFLVSYLLL